MKQTEFVYREILYQAMEKKNMVLTQAALARTLHVSLSVVNKAVKVLEHMGAVETELRSFHVLDIKKIIYYWASIRNLQKDIIYATRVEKPVREIEKMMPDNAVFTAYSAYKFRFHDIPADYSEVYVYGTKELAERFPQSKKVPNLFVLQKEQLIDLYENLTVAQLFVDLWNLKEWYAKEFLKALEERIHGILE